MIGALQPAVDAGAFHIEGAGRLSLSRTAFLFKATARKMTAATIVVMAEPRILIHNVDAVRSTGVCVWRVASNYYRTTRLAYGLFFNLDLCAYTSITCPFILVILTHYGYFSQGSPSRDRFLFCILLPTARGGTNEEQRCGSHLLIGHLWAPLGD